MYQRGPALFLGSPISASNSRPGGDPITAIRQGYLDRLTDRYQVIVMDYPPTGPDAVGAVASFDPDHVCADILAVADAAGADRFAWYGYSWGGVVGLQLAARTDRLSALISVVGRRSAPRIRTWQPWRNGWPSERAAPKHS